MSTLQKIIIRNLKTILCSLKQQNPSANRNQKPILDVLLKILDKTSSNLKLLEISSGTGQHSAFFANHFPNITFQPSEYDESMLTSIQAYALDSKYKNILNPIIIDISKDYNLWNIKFNENNFDYILNINMIHITPWKCTEGLFYNAGKLLKNHGFLITYGPYAINGILTPDSNVRFNNMLKNQNPEWGVRDIQDLKILAQKNSIKFVEMYDMPANNKILLWQKS